MDEKQRLLQEIREAGGLRRGALEVQSAATKALRRAAPLARDAGATVEEIAEAYGITRAGVYVVMDSVSEDDG